MEFEHGGLLGAAFRAAVVPTLVVDTAMRIVAANDAYERMTGRASAELEGSIAIEFVHADDLPGALKGLDRLRAGEPSVAQRRRHRRGDGTWEEVLAVSALFRHAGADYLLVQYPEHRPVDVDALAELESRALLGVWGDAVSYHDPAGRIVIPPHNLADRLGRTIEWLRGRRLTDPELRPVTPDGMPLDPADDPVLEALAKGVEVTRTIGLRTADRSVAWFSIRAGCLSRETIAARATLRDVSELIHAQHEMRALAALVERELAHQIEHDDLTGLKTRKVLISETEQALANEEQVALVFVDLDDFKIVNDELGHLAGDEVLVAVAETLTDLMPPGALLGRAGGDEFLLLAHSIAGAEGFASAVRERSMSPDGLVTVYGRRVGASVGVGVSKPGDTRSQLFSRADKAMYETKRWSRLTPAR